MSGLSLRREMYKFIRLDNSTGNKLMPSDDANHVMAAFRSFIKFDTMRYNSEWFAFMGNEIFCLKAMKTLEWTRWTELVPLFNK